MLKRKSERSVTKCSAILFTLLMIAGVLPLGSVSAANVSFTVGERKSYTAASTAITITQTGYYYVEAWGGNGGDGNQAGDQNWSVGTGGGAVKQAGLYYFTAETNIWAQAGGAGGGGSGRSQPGGSKGTGTYFGSGHAGGRGGNKSGNSNSNGGGGGGGGAASGILVGGTTLSCVYLASGGGGGGGGTGNNHYGANGRKGNDDSSDRTWPGTNVLGRQSGDMGGSWSITSTNAPDNSDINGGDGVLLQNGGGGGGGGGGGFDGNSGGGGGSGNGGQTSSSYGGGGGSGGKNFVKGTTSAPSGAIIPNNSRNNGENGQVYITFVQPAKVVINNYPEYKGNKLIVASYAADERLLDVRFYTVAANETASTKILSDLNTEGAESVRAYKWVDYTATMQPVGEAIQLTKVLDVWTD